LPSSPILLLSSQSEDRELLVSVLQRMGHVVSSFAEPGAALGAVAANHLVVVDMPVEAGAVAFCRAVRENPALADVAILCIAQTDEVEERVRFLEAGTDDVIARPYDVRELEARVEALLLRFQHTPTITPPPAAPGGPFPSSSKIIALFSPKGGAGSTTIAVNLALLLLERNVGRVAIMDLDLQWGQVATQLNVAPRASIVELARDSGAWDEAAGLKQYSARHHTGLVVYAAASRPDQAQLVGSDEMRRLLTAVQDHHELIVVDAGSVLDDRTLTIMELADRVIIPTIPEIPAIRVLHALLEFLSETGGILDKTTFVVNHVFAKDQVRLRDIESAVQARISLELPYDPIIYLKAANEGIPVALSAPKSAVAERLGRLASMVTDAPVASAPPPAVESGRGRLTGLLKRG
jgi:pilus assembly protein CpaE